MVASNLELTQLSIRLEHQKWTHDRTITSFCENLNKLNHLEKFSIEFRYFDFLADAKKKTTTSITNMVEMIGRMTDLTSLHFDIEMWKVATPQSFTLIRDSIMKLTKLESLCLKLMNIVNERTMKKEHEGIKVISEMLSGLRGLKSLELGIQDIRGDSDA
jgi:hypothetical protein